MSKKSNFMSFNILLILLVAIVIIGGFITYNYSYIREKFSNDNGSMIYYYMDGCGHCEHFNDKWDEFTKEYGSKFDLQKKDLNNSGDDGKTYGINGTPTIIHIKDGKKTEIDRDKLKTYADGILSTEKK